MKKALKYLIGLALSIIMYIIVHDTTLNMYSIRPDISAGITMNFYFYFAIIVYLLLSVIGFFTRNKKVIVVFYTLMSLMFTLLLLVDFMNYMNRMVLISICFYSGISILFLSHYKFARNEPRNHERNSKHSKRP